ncbi:MAG: hypothetical protein ACK47B_00800 [Armatimonadota bacterium]
MLRRAGFILITVALMAAGSLPMAWAARFTQGRTRQLKVCVLTIPTPSEPGSPMAQPDPDAVSQTRSPNPYPYVFYVLQNRGDLKPDGWSFVNPAAPATVSLEQAVRWGVAQGTALKPDMAAYWETPLNERNINVLRQMDVVYLPIARNPVLFTEDQRRMLTTMADSGVTIWVDWALPAATANDAMGGPNPLTRDPFFTNVDFGTVGGTAAVPPVRHPLLEAQYVLQDQEVLQVGSLYGTATAPGASRAVQTRGDAQPTANFTTVIPNSVAPTHLGGYVVAARMGAGYVIGTAGNVGGALAGQILTPANAATVRNQPVDLNRAQDEDLKFAYNIFAWRTEAATVSKDARHTGETNVHVQGLIEQGNFPHLLYPGSAGQPWINYATYAAANPAQLLPNPSSPLIMNGVVVAATRYRDAGNNPVSELNAFQTDPKDDFDSNGYLDDPIPSDATPPNELKDFSLGQPYDRILRLPLGPNTVVTGLTSGEIPDITGAGGAQSYVFATANTGLLSFSAPRPGVPMPTNTQLAPAVPMSYTGPAAFANIPGPIINNQPWVSSQLYAGGVVNSGSPFGGSSNGKVIAWNVAFDGSLNNGALPTPSAGPAWYYPANQEANRMGPVAGPVTVAQVQDAATGAIDTLVFTTSVSSGDSAGDVQGNQGGDTTGKVQGFIVATRGDVLAFPQGANAPGGGNPTAGRRFVSSRWQNLAPGSGAPPSAQELRIDPLKHVEVRVISRATGYVEGRYFAPQPGQTFNATQHIRLLPDGVGGQFELPEPPPAFVSPTIPGQWDLNRFILVADYSPLPVPVDNNAGLSMRPRFNPSTPYERNANGSVQSQIQPTGVAGGVAVGKDNLIYYGTGIGFMCAAEMRKGQAAFRWKMRAQEYLDGSGRSSNVDPTSGAYLNDYAFTAAPAAGSHIVFAARGRGGPGRVYVFDPNATIRFKLPIPQGSLNPTLAREVSIQADHGVGVNPNDPYLFAEQQPWGRYPNQFSVDPDTGVVTFLNMENFSLNLQNMVSPAQAAAQGVDTGGRPAVPINVRVGRQGMIAFQGTVLVPLPLVAVYQPNTGEQFLSSPVIASDRAILMGSGGFMHEIPLNPKTLNPNFGLGAGAGLAALDLQVAGLRRVRAVTVVPPTSPVTAPPVLSDDLLVATTPQGLTFYRSPNVVIADSNRIIEASGDSQALASTDAVLKHRVDNSEFAIPTDPAFSNTFGRAVLTERLPLNRPSTVRKLNRDSSLTSIFQSQSVTRIGNGMDPTVQEHSDLATESYLVADTGNNRCVEFNPLGKAVWDLTSFQDPFNILPAGESLSLRSPMDVQRWVEVERNTAVFDPGTGMSGTAPFVYVIHTLIADTGNHRVLEIVDKVLPQPNGMFTPASFPYTPNQVGSDGQPIRWYHVLVWSSQTNAQGLKLNYRTAQRIFWTDEQGNPIPTQAPPGNVPGEAVPHPPYLPHEPYLSYTMCAVNGQIVGYPETGAAYVSYNRFYAGNVPDSVVHRKPITRGGGDSIVFLRGRYRAEQPGELAQAPPAAVGFGGVGPFDFRVPVSNGSQQVRFAQGVVDPNVPVLTHIWDDVRMSGANLRPVHRLNGITSVQRTVRTDVRFAPDMFSPNAPMRPQMYFLVADRDGVWECRFLAGQFVPNISVPDWDQPRFRLTWALNGPDYAAITGGRRLTPSSARRLDNGMVLITNRTPAPDPTAASGSAIGSDVFILQPADFATPELRGGQPYDPVNVAMHGWRPDRLVQANSNPSIRWRAAEVTAANQPPSLAGSYVPIQPTYADVVD